MGHFLNLLEIMLSLRIATIADADNLVDLDRLCFGKLWSRDQYLREIESPNSDIVLLLKDEQLIAYGCVWAIVDEAHITILGTHPKHLRKGYAREVLKELLRLAIAREMKRATLEVKESNAAAIALYETFGFEEAGRRKKYYSDTQEDALILWTGGLQTGKYQNLLAE
jgi:[ribosomal protein S18]-alanine N-acetyltransferase